MGNSLPAETTLWDRCVRNLQAELPEQQFNTWIRPLQAIEDGRRLKLLAPNRFVVDWLQQHYIERILEIVDNHGASIEVIVEVGSRDLPVTAPMRRSRIATLEPRDAPPPPAAPPAEPEPVAVVAPPVTQPGTVEAPTDDVIEDVQEETPLTTTRVEETADPAATNAIPPEEQALYNALNQMSQMPPVANGNSVFARFQQMLLQLFSLILGLFRRPPED